MCSQNANTGSISPCWWDSSEYKMLFCFHPPQQAAPAHLVWCSVCYEDSVNPVSTFPLVWLERSATAPCVKCCGRACGRPGICFEVYFHNSEKQHFAHAVIFADLHTFPRDSVEIIWNRKPGSALTPSVMHKNIIVYLPFCVCLIYFCLQDLCDFLVPGFPQNKIHFRQGDVLFPQNKKILEDKKLRLVIAVKVIRV